jgi:hypothetical protein
MPASICPGLPFLSEAPTSAMLAGRSNGSRRCSVIAGQPRLAPGERGLHAILTQDPVELFA